MIDNPSLSVTGVGVLLPGGEMGSVNSTDEFWNVINNNICCISSYKLDNLPIKIAGQVKGWDATKELDIPNKYLEKYSRGTLLAVASVKRALEDANISPRELSNDRTLLIFNSVLFTIESLSSYYQSYAESGHSGIGIGFWISGTPGSMPSTICSLLDIECQTMVMSGSCNVGSKAFQTAVDLFKADRIDRAIVVGVDAPLDPIFLSASLYKAKSGYRAASLSGDPESIRPHDNMLNGNAPGEGAVTIILEKSKNKVGKSKFFLFELYGSSSRKNGTSPVSSGNPVNFYSDLKSVLQQSKVNLSDIGFINDFCEGSLYIEAFYSEAINIIRREFDYTGVIKLSNHEGTFGHIPGAAGLIKFLANILMMHQNIITPVTNCKEKYCDLEATPVIEKSEKVNLNHSLVVSGGSGGDATTLLIKKRMGR